MDGAALEAPHKREDLISSVHSQETFQHSASGDEIIRPNPVNGQNSGLTILIGECLQDVSDALTSSLGGQGALEGSSGGLN